MKREESVNTPQPLALNRKIFSKLLWGGVVVLLLFLAALFIGSVRLAPSEVLAALTGNGDDAARFIVVETRLPAAITAVLAGASLAVGGLVMQTLFANPLADPSLLGVSSGASLGAALTKLLLGSGLSLGLASFAGTMLTTVAALVGALVVIALLTLLSRTLHSSLSLLVAGVMLSFLISALIALLSYYATADGLQQFVLWGMGTFAGVSLGQLPLFAALVVVASFFILLLSRPLNALLLGADYATNLGVDVRRVRTALLVLVGLLTAVVTAFCGPISFIGLAVPHMARLALRTADHRVLFPMSLLLGAGVALLSLLLTHLPGTSGVLPLAAITPLIGVPVVLSVLFRMKTYV